MNPEGLAEGNRGNRGAVDELAEGKPHMLRTLYSLGVCVCKTCGFHKFNY